MKKTIVAVCVIVGITATGSMGCSAVFDPCPGQVDCGGGNCAPAGSVCCSETTYCNAGETCGPNNTCLNSSVGGCLASGEETCVNNDGTEDCAPIGASCCGNHRYCPAGTVCVNGGTSCS